MSRKRKKTLTPENIVGLLCNEGGKGIGQSKRDHPNDKNSLFFRWETMHEYAENFKRVITVIFSQYHISRIDELTPEMFQWYLDKAQFDDVNVGSNTRQKYEAQIMKFFFISQRHGWISANAERWIPKRKYTAKKQTTPPNPLLVREEIALTQYLSAKDPMLFTMFLVQKAFGLRLAELCFLLCETVSEDGLTLNLNRRSHTKGGRPRTVCCYDKEIAKRLVAACNAALKRKQKKVFANNNNEDSKRLKTVYTAFLQDGYRACELEHSKTHDLRATFAVNRYYFYLKQGCSKEEALANTSQDLGHGRSRFEHGLAGSYIPGSVWDQDIQELLLDFEDNDDMNEDDENFEDIGES